MRAPGQSAPRRLTAIAQRLGYVESADTLHTGKVGNRARDAQHPSVAPRRQAHCLGRLGKQLPPTLVGGCELGEHITLRLGVGTDRHVAIARRLHGPRRSDPPSDFGRSLGRWREYQVGGGHRLDLDVQVDAVEKCAAFKCRFPRYSL
jgi:hypothetical protein